MLLDFLTTCAALPKSPFLRRQIRIRMLSRRALVPCVVFLLLVGGELASVGMEAVSFIRNGQSAGPVFWSKLFTLNSGVAAVLFCVLGTLQTITAVARERTEQTIDLLRSTPFTPMQIVLGFLVGGPVMEYAFFVLCMGLGAVPCLVGAVPKMALAKVAVSVLSTGVLMHAVGMVVALLIRIPRNAMVTAIVVECFLAMVVGLAYSNGFRGLACVGGWPVWAEAQGPEMLQRFVWGGNGGVGLEYIFSVPWGGMMVPAMAAMLIGQLLGFTIAIMIAVRCLRYPGAPFLSRRMLLVTFCYVAFIILPEMPAQFAGGVPPDVLSGARNEASASQLKGGVPAGTKKAKPPRNPDGESQLIRMSQVESERVFVTTLFIFPILAMGLAAIFPPHRKYLEIQIRRAFLERQHTVWSSGGSARSFLFFLMLAVMVVTQILFALYFTREVPYPVREVSPLRQLLVWLYYVTAAGIVILEAGVWRYLHCVAEDSRREYSTMLYFIAIYWFSPIAAGLVLFICWIQAANLIPEFPGIVYACLVFTPLSAPFLVQDLLQGGFATRMLMYVMPAALIWHGVALWLTFRRLRCVEDHIANISLRIIPDSLIDDGELPPEDGDGAGRSVISMPETA